MLNFCTYFDNNYVSRVLAMYESLRQHCPEFHLYMLCFDGESVKLLESMNLANATVITQEAFEAGDENLTATKDNRTKLEYYETCGPSLPLYIFKTFPQVDLITYLDADLFFYSDPQPLIDEIDSYSIGLTVHNFPEYKSTQTTGKYNVGWLSFRRDQNGIKCLTWWRDRCIEWCYERHENGKYADQKYLEQWPMLFDRVKVLEHKGANVALWNVADYRIYEENGKVMVSGFPLVFYHFAGLKQLSRFVFNPGLPLTMGIPSKVLRNKVHRPYIAELLRHGLAKAATPSIRGTSPKFSFTLKTKRTLHMLLGIALRQYIVVIDSKSMR